MAPSKSMKTYGRGSNSSVNGMEAINILFAKNITARKLNNKVTKAKKKIEIKKLPKRCKGTLLNESLHVNIDDTFDKILKGPKYNVVKTRDFSVKIDSQNTSQSIINHFSFTPFSPISYKLRSHSSRAQISDSTDTYSWFKRPTLTGEGITNSLEIDKIGSSNCKDNKNGGRLPKKSFRESPIMLRSRSKLSDASSIKKDSKDENQKLTKSHNASESITVDSNVTSGTVFTNSVKERILVHSSTPIVNNNNKKRLIKQPISPIKLVENEVESCIAESLEEISNWDTSFPRIEPKNNSLLDIEGFHGFTLEEKLGKSSFDTEQVNFLIQRSPTYKKVTSQDTEETEISKLNKKATPLRSKSFHLEDFESFHSRISQNERNTSVSAKDFEIFHAKYKNLISLNEDEYSDNSEVSFMPVNFVTNRKVRLRDKYESVSLKYLNLSKKFDLKDLVVVLDNVLTNNFSAEFKKQSKALSHVAMMNSISKTQPGEKLARFSLGCSDIFKAKNRLRNDRVIPCRKFSSNCVPSVFMLSRENLSKFNNVTCELDDLDDARFKELIINITQLPLADNENTRPDISNVKICGSSKSVTEPILEESSDETNNKSVSIFENSSKVTNDNENSQHKLGLLGLTNDHSYCIQKRGTSLVNENLGTESSSDLVIDERTKSGSNKKNQSCRQIADKTSVSPDKFTNSSLRCRKKDTELRKLDLSHLRDISRYLFENTQRNTETPSINKIPSSSIINISSSSDSDSDDDIFSCLSEDLEAHINASLSNILHSDSIISSAFLDIDDYDLDKKTEESSLPKTSKIKELVVNLTFKNLEDLEMPKNRAIDSEGKGENAKKSITGTESSPSLDIRESITTPGVEILTKETVTNEDETSPKEFLRFASEIHNSPQSRASCNSDSDIINSSINSPYLSKWKEKVLNLKAGKSWRRSLLSRRNQHFEDLFQEHPYSYSKCRNSPRPQNFSARRRSRKIVPASDGKLWSRKSSVLHTYAQTNLSTVLDESIDAIIGISPTKRKSSLDKPLPIVTANEIVLKKCKQTEPLPFEKCYPETLLKDCKKIGEGVYGEVFSCSKPNGECTVMKVIPIEGDKIVNGERQKKFDEILSEIVIASELSKLREQTPNQTSIFSEVQRICCVKGKYPKKLLDLWHAFDDAKGSENDPPEVFDEDQLYVVLELANGGQDLEAFVFNNASQAVAMFKQVACALAVAEENLHFEHRDLHWGNVLLTSVDKNKKIVCKHKGEEIITHTKGVQVTVIDFTLSRVEHDGVVIFNDLGQDPDLFDAEGDYQFEIYRLMKAKNNNDWQKFEPYTNILWLHYILDKSISALRYKNTKTKIHKESILSLKELKKAILKFNSASQFVSSQY